MTVADFPILVLISLSSEKKLETDSRSKVGEESSTTRRVHAVDRDIWRTVRVLSRSGFLSHRLMGDPNSLHAQDRRLYDYFLYSRFLRGKGDIVSLFVEKHGEIKYEKQLYCPNNKDFKRYIGNDHRIFLERVGVTRHDLDSLSCIHVAGTKGKGSTCAMTERILRNYGYKTGLISSPPLLEVRERVRINGAPVSRGKFGKYGLECLELLKKNKGKYGKSFVDMPGTFSIFTIVAYYTLVKEKVDVAVVEVGLGGEYDSTNAIWSPTVTGVSSLAIEHASLLGNTLAEIAWHKAGIFKDGRPAFTVPQREEAMEVLINRANERNTTLQLCPPLSAYEFNDDSVQLGLAGKHQRCNAALAVQLTKTWLEEKHPGSVHFQVIKSTIDDCTINGDNIKECKVRRATPFVIPDEFLQGFALAKWPGRNQTIRKPGVTYYIDNAHTQDSVAFCKNWFDEEASNEAKTIQGVVKKILIFNLGGERSAYNIMPPLVEYGFDGVVFSVMRTVEHQENEVRDYKSDDSLDDQLIKCQQHLATFKKLQAEMCNSVSGQSPIFKVASSATAALQWILGSRLEEDGKETAELPYGEGFLQEADHLQVLVTGSNFIVGSVIHVIQPNMLENIKY
ncbi:folylpolyglutamate synthase, mitochondrial-like [Lytechinus pictus]|uniref:folylpolyglutamate synthase, mitochondrial-like n=1 Tax=Lytechinus pictus TaxID=7653 RepID=UPI0030B9E57E